MATTTPATPETPGTTNTAGLAPWAAPYITNYLGQAQALGQQPYQTYQGPLTAGPSALQNKVFEGLGALSMPQNLGGSFTSAGTMGVPQASVAGNLQGVSAGTGIAANYMNPYLQNVLQPQLEEMRRQAQINLQPTLSKFTGAGGYGGSREAIMRSEADRNLLDQMTGAIGKGYSSAFDMGRQQFNTEQQQGRDLVNLMGQAGGQQRAIEQEGVEADLSEFNRQREYPYKQVQFMRDMISGLPIGSVSSNPAQLSGLAALIGALGGADKLVQATGQGSLSDLLKNLFGFNMGGGEAT